MGNCAEVHAGSSLLDKGEEIMIRGVKFVGVPVKDQDAALKFWTEKVGLKIATDQEMGPGQRWIELSIPGAETGLALFTPEGHEDRIGTFQSVSFWCDDVVTTAKALESRGVKFVKPPKKEEWGTAAIFADADGNKFVLSSR
jgi:predicted enzyme related to lactoylglutathione lyase